MCMSVGSSTGASTPAVSAAPTTPPVSTPPAPSIFSVETNGSIAQGSSLFTLA